MIDSKDSFANPKDSVFLKAAVSYGYLSQSQMEECLQIKDTCKQEGRDIALEEILVTQEVMSADGIGEVYCKINEELNSLSDTKAPGQDATMHTEVVNKKKPMASTRRNPVASPSRRLTKEALGKTIGNRYEIKEMLGRGGMGIVYLAEDARLQRPVAIKVLLCAQEDIQIERFHREAITTANLNHPNIVAVYDMDTLEDGNLYLVMEYVAGKALSDVIKEKAPMDIKESVELIRQVADALHVAHENNIIHRDIKPANIMITEKGSAKVADFGLAKITSSASLSGSGQLVGTPYYIPPEQVESSEVDGRSDIYSLGITFYQMLTGQLPFRGDSVYGLLMAHLDQNARPIREYNKNVPEAIEKIVELMMARKKDDRFQSAKALVEALVGFTQGQMSVSKISIVPQRQKPSFFKRLLSLVVIFLLLTTIFAVVLWKFFPQRWHTMQSQTQTIVAKIEKYIFPPAVPKGPKTHVFLKVLEPKNKNLISPKFTSLGGKTFQQEIHISKGEYLLIVDHPGYKRVEEKVKIPQLENPYIIEKVLVAKPCKVIFDISYSVKPKAATPKFYWKYQQKLDHFLSLTKETTFTPGKYLFKITHPGYREVIKEISIVAGKSSIVEKVVLEALPRAISWRIRDSKSNKVVNAYQVYNNSKLLDENSKLATGKKLRLHFLFRFHQNIEHAIVISPGEEKYVVKLPLVPLTPHQIKLSKINLPYTFYNEKGEIPLQNIVKVNQGENEDMYMLYLSKESKKLRISYGFYYKSLFVNDLPKKTVKLSQISISLLIEKLSELKAKNAIKALRQLTLSPTGKKAFASSNEAEISDLISFLKKLKVKKRRTVIYKRAIINELKLLHRK